MGTRKHRQRQEDLWVTHSELPTAPGHPFYKRLNALLDQEKFDEFAEKECAQFYADKNGRPSLTPGTYFRSLLIGYFEGIDSERGIAWRAADSLGLRQFLQIGLDESTPDHSTISRTRRLIDIETHRKVFGWVLGVLADRGLLKGKMVGVDATTLEANAAMRSIVRRDNGQRYEAFLTGLAKKSGIATPTREDLARIDRKRKKKGSNQEWRSATDADARIAKMKDGSTHMAHKAEHAVDMESGAVIAVTLQAADQGDTTTIHETLAEAGEAVAELVEREAGKTLEAKPQVHVNGITEMVADKGYHSGKTMLSLEQVEVRSYIPEPKRGRRKWEGKAEEQQAVYANRRRVKGHHGKQLLKRRGELVGTLLCPLLRNRRDETNASARAREHPEAAADSCVRIQLKPDLPADAGCGNASRTEKPAGNSHFGVYMVADCVIDVRPSRAPALNAPRNVQAVRAKLVAGVELGIGTAEISGLHHSLLASVRQLL